MEPRSPLLRLRKILGRVRRRFALDTFDVFGRKLVAGDAEFTAPAGYRFAWGEAEDVLACDAYHTELDEQERSSGVRRLALGHGVVLGFAEDRAADGEPGAGRRQEVVFSMWVNPRHVNVPGHVKLRLTEDQRFIYKAFTSPDHRGHGLYRAGMAFVLADMARRELGQLVGYAHVKKGISRRGLAALGFEQLGRFRTLDIPGLRRTMVSARLRGRFPPAVTRPAAPRAPGPSSSYPR